ncbi:MAG: UDP-N-acetylmuramoyl-tripeptide--D-alanyl-D-alanine ligase [Crocinitomicaceae bacterium]|nr:UDP-N-acetylmuramoyl-tripeptide--D-alanyl-D-alanine ligase [Crocinitomicaceae bacterium]
MNTSIFQPFYNSSGICTDTRSIQENSLFICIKGDNFDGNTFASQAIESGASHVIIDNPSYFVDNGTMTLVENSIKYLQKLANFHRNKFDIPVIGITGSNGKTTTKELILEVLSKKYNVLATIGNLNNQLGVPFTLLRMKEEHEVAIIEMGANKFKDIEELCDITEPTHGIITNIGKAHLEGFIDFDGVLKTKKELYDAIEKVKGTIIINEDDSTLMNITPVGISLVTYGADQPFSIVQGKLLNLSPCVQMNWKSETYQSNNLSTQMIGKYNFYNYLAAVAFGYHFGVSNEAISEALEGYSPTNNRSQVKKTDSNTLILDCYNANPTSMQSALESFSMNNDAHKLFIIGDMKELGPDTSIEHQKVIQQIESLGLMGIVVGDEFGKIKSASILKHFKNAEDARQHLKENKIDDHLILLKGSRSIGLEIIEKSL